MMTQEILLLIGHGSRDAEGNEEFLEMVRQLKEKNPHQRIDAAFVELAEPSIRTALDRYADPSPKTVWIMPVLFFAAAHSKVEIPEIVNEARRRLPHVTFHYGAPLGIHPILLDIVHERVVAAEKTSSPCSMEETAILLIGRGSSDPDANGDLHKIARLYWERYSYGWVESCFIGVTHPDLPTGLKRCIRLGAKRVIAIPYFIFTGVLIKRIHRIISEEQASHPELEMVAGDYLGRHPALLTLIEERFDAIRKGPVLMNCDLCKYRVHDLVTQTDSQGRNH
ncbi:MAG: sirohydrochlorin chelatase (plasmid) [Candidatus Manganitrophus sp.]|nr:sirohydrochlorin chelatase [Candidatus Manganitrophus sp.]MDC4228209.1 sirohydrochlorin chelatase [Candidatus Manganitrophus sp.]WDT73536.1 MAG: sirohydrochlorin chelatase [Candidatus Manganitrophus sp.]